MPLSVLRGALAVGLVLTTFGCGGSDDADDAASADVRVCEDDDLAGTCEAFGRDDPDLRDNTVGNDRISSIEVPPGGKAALYEDVDFEGACSAYEEGTQNVAVPVGDNRTSSLAVGRGCSNPTEPPSGGALVCDQDNLRGTCEAMAADDPDLRDNTIGNDRISSIEVPPGSRVAVFADIDFEGACTALEEGTHNIGPPVGNNEASSIAFDRGCPPEP